jgi:hypothetical protein
MKIFATTLEIQSVAPDMGDQRKRPAVGLEIKLLSFSPPEFYLIFETSAEAIAAITAVEQFISKAARTNFALHLLPV